MKNLILILFLFSLSSTVYSADRYWIASSLGQWNNTANWSATDGGPGGASVPSNGDFVYFNANGLGNCNLDVAAAFDGINTENYSGIIDLRGFSFNPTVSGNEDCSFLGGTINDSPGTSEINYSTSGRTRFQNVKFGAIINIESGRIEFNGGVFNAIVTAEQTGSAITNGDGGCIFTENTIIINSGSSRLILGRINPDEFLKDLDIINSGSGRIFLAENSSGNIVTGDLKITGNGSSEAIILSEDEFSSLAVAGDMTVLTTSSASNSSITIGNSGSVSIAGRLDVTQNATGDKSRIFIANAETSKVSVNGVSKFINNGVNDDTRTNIGFRGDVSFGDSLILINNSTSSTNQFILNRNSGSSNIYNGHIVVSNTQSDGDGVYFGNAGGSGVLAANRRVSIGSGGFVSGKLRFGNFNQTGTTAQSLTLTGTAELSSESSDWGGDFNGVASGVTTHSSRFHGNTYIEKTGNETDDSKGNNFFDRNVVLKNSGKGRFIMGSDNPDVFQMNLDIDNSGESNIFIANSSANNIIVGYLSINNDGFGLGSNIVRIGNDAVSSITIGGDVFIKNVGSADNSRVFFPHAGGIVLNGDLIIDNSPQGKDGEVNLSASLNSSLAVNGILNLIQTANGGVTKRTYIGERGSVVINGNTSISNNSDANNNFVLIADKATSSVTFNGNVVVENTHINGEGVQFGKSGGTTSLANGFTLTIGSGGFATGELIIENLTQTGLTAQNITLTGSASFETIGSSWEGDVSFISPRIISENTTYRGLSYLEKNGAINDNSEGGNTFERNCIIKNTGSGHIRMGNSSFDRWEENLTLLSEGDGDLAIAYGAFGNFIAGDLTVMASSGAGSAQQVVIANQITSSLSVGGNTTVINNSNGVRNDVIIGENGKVYFIGDLEITNSSTSNRAEIILAKSTSAEITVSGNTTVLNSGLGGNIKQIYVGNSGDIRFIGSLNLTLTSNASDAEIFLNHDIGSENVYFQGVTINAPSSLSDGVYFGANGGTGTLSSGSNISIGPDGFIAENLLMQNLIQMGSTAQVIELNTGTTRLESNNSIWNGDVVFRSPKLFSNNSTYHSSAILHKTGADNDESDGGNTFYGITVLRNTGSGDFKPSNVIGNTFNEDVTYEKAGTGDILPTYNSTSKYAKSIIINSNDVMVFGASGGGTVSMNGTGPQFISVVGATPKPEFAAFETSNPNDDITLNTPIEIINFLVLLQGNINTTDINMLFMSDNSFVISVSNNAFVNGPVTKIGNDLFTFPVGKANFYRPIRMASKPDDISAQFRAEYFPQNVVSSGTPNSPLEISIFNISSCEYWLLDRLASSSSVVVELSYRNTVPGSCSGVVDQSTLLVSRWNGSLWEDLGNGGISGNASNGSVKSFGAVPDFSTFTIGTTNDVNPLPIELTEFEVKKQDASAMVNWTTASELNNDYFDLERSTDGFNFESISKLDGAGNSTHLINYNHLDRYPEAGISYYRLKQVDFDGKFSYSDIKSILFDDIGSLNIYPNPLNTGHDLMIASNQVISSIEIINETGQLIRSAKFDGKQNEVKLSNLSLTSGFYFVKVYSDMNLEVEKLIVR
ncbi:T9SS type A sorting domain-containing protein [Brumimicrobium glaciale]|uniref:T9SS type A sorting domain-containing protein n=1 Tax=Brumimicrobium glaciale TaxID=200475 RepID=A0A4Q4KFJ7_9FLAO|nr:T9SS type A sorting domain-containing protein [Brumimicrobium glaciale]RYM31450.1 T9SS type A sorting domain-containing protein [Brumimicrobium glaciale]